MGEGGKCAELVFRLLYMYMWLGMEYCFSSL